MSGYEYDRNPRLLEAVNFKVVRQKGKQLAETVQKRILKWALPPGVPPCFENLLDEELVSAPGGLYHTYRARVSFLLSLDKDKNTGQNSFFAFLHSRLGVIIDLIDAGILPYRLPPEVLAKTHIKNIDPNFVALQGVLPKAQIERYIKRNTYPIKVISGKLSSQEYSASGHPPNVLGRFNSASGITVSTFYDSLFDMASPRYPRRLASIIAHEAAHAFDKTPYDRHIRQRPRAGQSREKIRPYHQRKAELYAVAHDVIFNMNEIISRRVTPPELLRAFEICLPDDIYDSEQEKKILQYAVAYFEDKGMLVN